MRLLREAGAIIVGKTVQPNSDICAGTDAQPGESCPYAWRFLKWFRGRSGRRHGASGVGDANRGFAYPAGLLLRRGWLCGREGPILNCRDNRRLSHSFDSLGLIYQDRSGLSGSMGIPQPIRNSRTGSAHRIRLNFCSGAEVGLGEVSKEMSEALIAANQPQPQLGFHFSVWSEHGMVRDLAEQHATVMASEASAARTKSWHTTMN